jgi:formylglycine-generating enzyme required for sulfatase activity
MVRDALVWNEHLYLVMDFIEGETLADVVRDGGVDPERGAEILSQVLAGLEAIHMRGIVHRDLKASNILLDREGTAFISDFGIAECVVESEDTAAMGTAKNAAPEVVDPALARGARPEQADIYAAGMLAYEMLLGRQRFQSEFPRVYNGAPKGVADRWLRWQADLATAARNLNEIDPTIPMPLARVVERMMEKDVNDRYRDAGDARRDLEGGRTGKGATRRPSAPSDEDATVALPRDRAPRSAPPARSGAPAARRTADEDAPPPARRSAPPAARPAAPARPAAAPARKREAAARRPLPWWTWWAVGGAVFVLAAGVLLYFIFGGSHRFTLMVKGAQPGSRVYVDNRLMAGKTRTDGSIEIPLLDSAKTHVVLVSCDGFEDYPAGTVRGGDGEVVSVTVAQVASGSGKPSATNEIDYNGRMVFIPAGAFPMGSDSGEANERPVHEVHVEDFYIDKFEVTNKQYREFCDATGYKMPPPPYADPDYLNKPDHPVLGVTWQDAVEYAKWAGKRLPTEEEWEKAASWGPSATEKRQWPWGNTFEASKANFKGTSPAPGGKYPGDSSGYGVMDMGGNVWEWVDAYYKPYQGNGAADPHYGTTHRVVRGGSFTPNTESSDLRTTRRGAVAGDYSRDEKEQKSSVIGFRCAVSADDPRFQKARAGSGK